MKSILAVLILTVFCVTAHAITDVCPPMDFSGDCAVGLEDVVIFVEQWLDSEPNSPQPDIVWVYVENGGFVGEVAKTEITNSQYCQFLNAALISGDITVSNNKVYGADGSNTGTDFIGEIYYDLAGQPCELFNGNNHNAGGARINYNGTFFTVDGQYAKLVFRAYEGHPVNHISWYGTVAFCNYYGWRLPDEWEWEEIANHYYPIVYENSFPQSDQINCCGGGISGTCDWWAYGPNGFGFGLCHMFGNVREWTSSLFGSEGNYMFRGGGWGDVIEDCTFTHRDLFGAAPDTTSCFIGFRPCR